MQVDKWQTVSFDNTPLLRVRIFLRIWNNEIKADNRHTERRCSAFKVSAELGMHVVQEFTRFATKKSSGAMRKIEHFTFAQYAVLRIACTAQICVVLFAQFNRLHPFVACAVFCIEQLANRRTAIAEKARRIGLKETREFSIDKRTPTNAAIKVARDTDILTEFLGAFERCAEGFFIGNIGGSVPTA